MPESLARMWPSSVRARLLLGLSLPLIFFMAMDAWATFGAATKAAQTAFDRLLVTSAHAVADLIKLERGQLVISLPHASLEIYDHTTAIEANEFESRSRGRMLYRVGFLDGSYLGGDKELRPYTRSVPSHPVYGSMIALYDEHGETPMRIAALLQPVESFDGARLIVVQVAESSRYRSALATQILRETLVRQVALLVALLLLIWLVSTVALRPFQRLAHQLDRHSEQEPAAMPDVQVPLELRPVAHSFARLMRRLADAQDQQRRFVADASHQLRTPLTVLQLQAESALRGDLPVQEALQSMTVTTQRATRLAEQLLSLARAQQTTTRDAAGAVDVRALASETVVELSPLIAGKQLDFRFDCAPHTLRVHGWMLQEVLANLLRNAIEYTPEGGALGLRFHLDDAHAVLTVWDTGPGLSAAMRERLFRPFTTDRASRGAGLGLTICRDLSRAMGALLTLTDRPGASGLEARIVLPASSSH